MIKANELRIDNWVIGSDAQTPFKTEFHKVTGFDLYGQRNDFFVPIPLTPEILEKCGFEVTVSESSISIIGSILFVLDNDGDEYNIFLRQENTDNTTEVLLLPNPIKYLHQLQNLYFALTGEELEIKLNVATTN